MKLLITIVQDDDAHNLISELNANNILCTKLSSTGGFLRYGNTTIIIGIEDELMDKVVELIKNTCTRRKLLISSASSYDALNGLHIYQGFEVETGGANIFAVNIDRMIRL